ncbi:MAG: Phosphate transport system permease protein PstC [candidate division WS2 bacterium]|nr:Phosphate transport system permease protein PstC [Candidatus Lithacetigena glycinireducens]
MKFSEKIINFLIIICGYSAIVFSVAIFVYILKESLPFFKHYSWLQFITGFNWYPVSEPPVFGLLPLLSGTLIVSMSASILSLPLGLILAIYISEVAPRSIKNVLKSSLEFLVGIPTVILGALALKSVVPFLRTAFNLPTGLTGLAGALFLALMALPIMASMAEDVLEAVNPNLKEGSLSLGATRWQTIKYILFPVAKSGIIAASLLSIGRIFGETMVVLMVTGNAPQVVFSLLKPVRVLTATIGAEMGEAVLGSVHYHALFTLGLILLIFSSVVNIISYYLLKK